MAKSFLLITTPLKDGGVFKEASFTSPALSPKIGYDGAAKIAKEAHKNGTTLKEESIKSGLISEKEYDKIVNPKKMINPQ